MNKVLDLSSPTIYFLTKQRKHNGTRKGNTMELDKKSLEDIVQGIIAHNGGDYSHEDAYYIGYRLLSHFSLYNPISLEIDKEDKMIKAKSISAFCVKKKKKDAGHEFFIVIRNHDGDMVSTSPIEFFQNGLYYFN